jgi:hypothetical protein
MVHCVGKQAVDNAEDSSSHSLSATSASKFHIPAQITFIHSYIQSEPNIELIDLSVRLNDIVGRIFMWQAEYVPVFDLGSTKIGPTQHYQRTRTFILVYHCYHSILQVQLYTPPVDVALLSPPFAALRAEPIAAGRATISVMAEHCIHELAKQ